MVLAKRLCGIIYNVPVQMFVLDKCPVSYSSLYYDYKSSFYLFTFKWWVGPSIHCGKVIYNCEAVYRGPRKDLRTV